MKKRFLFLLLAASGSAWGQANQGGLPVNPAGGASNASFPATSYTCNGTLALAYPTATNFAVANVSVTGNCTLTLSGGSAGQGFQLIVIATENSTGGYSITNPTGVLYPNGTPPTFSTAANAKNKITFLTPDGGTTTFGGP